MRNYIFTGCLHVTFHFAQDFSSFKVPYFQKYYHSTMTLYQETMLLLTQVFLVNNLQLCKEWNHEHNIHKDKLFISNDMTIIYRFKNYDGTVYVHRYEKAQEYVFLDKGMQAKTVKYCRQLLVSNNQNVLPKTQPATARNPLSHNFLLKMLSVYMKN